MKTYMANPAKIERKWYLQNALKRLFNIEGLNYSSLKVIGDNDNDYEMLKTFDGAVMKNHHEKLDSLHKKEYETLNEYIEELINNQFFLI